MCGVEGRLGTGQGQGWGLPLEQGEKTQTQRAGGPRITPAPGQAPRAAHQVPARTLLPRIGGEGELTIWEEGLSATHSLLQPPAPRRHGRWHLGQGYQSAHRTPGSSPEDQRHFRLPLALVSPGTITAISTWVGFITTVTETTTCTGGDRYSRRAHASKSSRQTPKRQGLSSRHTE